MVEVFYCILNIVWSRKLNYNEDNSLVSPITDSQTVQPQTCTRCVRKVKIHHVLADRETFYAYYGNTAVDLDPLPVSRARLTVVEPALFE